MSEQGATELIGDYQDEQIDLDTVSKLEHREDHSVLEAELVKGEPLYPHELTRDAVLSMYVMALFFYLSAFVPPPLHGAADPTAGTRPGRLALGRPRLSAFTGIPGSGHGG